MEEVVIVLLALCGFLLGASAYGSYLVGIGTGTLIAVCFYYLIEIGR